MHSNEAVQYIQKLGAQIGPKWEDYLTELKKRADSDDQSQIAFSDFVSITRRYGANLSQAELKCLLEVFPGQQAGAKGPVLNIARVFDQEVLAMLQKMYNKVRLTEHDPCPDDPQDTMGYLGLNEWHREKSALNPITEDELIRVFKEDDSKLKWIISSIREIDRDHNGYVTRTELDDILKVHMPKELGDKDLHPIIRKFSSISNKILIDYKQLQAWLKEGAQRLDAKREERSTGSVFRKSKGLFKTPGRDHHRDAGRAQTVDATQSQFDEKRMTALTEYNKSRLDDQLSNPYQRDTCGSDYQASQTISREISRISNFKKQDTSSALNHFMPAKKLYSRLSKYRNRSRASHASSQRPQTSFGNRGSSVVTAE